MIQVLMYIMAGCAVLGGLDRIFHNRFGLGGRFEEGFQMLGPVAMSMAGIICIAPLLSSVLGAAIRPVYHALHQDPGMFGSILAIDMGGYQMAEELADDPAVGTFAGILAAATLGCTVSFTIPTGMGLYSERDRKLFAQGILYGLVSIPAALVFGALLCGFSLKAALWICLPVLVLAGLLIFCIWKKPEQSIRGFSMFASALRAVTTIGLMLGAFQYISGIVILPMLAPLEEAMTVISAICITLLGSLPMAQILEWMLKKPFSMLGRRIGIGHEAVMGMLLSFLNTTAGLAAIPGMNDRGKIVSSAFTVCAGSCLSAHFAFTMSVKPDMALPMILTKLMGALLGAAFALLMTGRETEKGMARMPETCGK